MPILYHANLLFPGKALVECANKVAEQRGQPGSVVGYEEIAEAAFGRLGRAIISAIIYTELFGTCCVLFILEQVRKGILRDGRAEASSHGKPFIGLYKKSPLVACHHFLCITLNSHTAFW